MSNAIEEVELVSTPTREITRQAKAEKHLANIDRLRILAVIGVIAHHTFNVENIIGRNIAKACLPVFVMIFIALISQTAKHDNLGSFAGKKFQRLMKPWLFWSLVYAMAKIVKQLLIHEAVPEAFHPYMIFTGTAIHLWFLSFAFPAALLIFYLQSQMKGWSSRTVIITATIAGGAALLLCSTVMSVTKLPIPLAQWALGLPAVPIGFALGKIYTSQERQLQKIFYGGVALTTAVVCILLVCLNYTHLVISYAIATAAVCAAFVRQGRMDFITQRWASLSYGIYLSHALVAYPLYYFNFAGDALWLKITTVFLVASLLSFIMQKTPLRKFI